VKARHATPYSFALHSIPFDTAELSQTSSCLLVQIQIESRPNFVHTQLSMTAR